MTIDRSAGVLRSLAAVITHKCQASCTQCYNGSGPDGTHGTMALEDWLSVLFQASEMGTQHVQFIGGEPTMHPNLGELIAYALDHGMKVEVFSNLIHVSDTLWPVLRRDGVTLGTSYYSRWAKEHDAITNRRGSYKRTTENILKAVNYGIPLRAEIIAVEDDQDIEGAVADLAALGVTSTRITRVRAIGRAAEDSSGACATSELCGLCAHEKAAVLPDGRVTACIMSENMMHAGSIHDTPLAKIFGGVEWQNMASQIPDFVPATTTACSPDVGPCGAACGPDLVGPCGAAVVGVRSIPVEIL